jgi:hypothetical protein
MKGASSQKKGNFAQRDWFFPILRIDKDHPQHFTGFPNGSGILGGNSSTTSGVEISWVMTGFRE